MTEKIGCVQHDCAECVARLAQPEHYDQTALELCDKCGWRTLIPEEACLNCERKAHPERPWVGLTDEEKQEWIDAMPYDIEPRHCMILVNVIEAKLKEKNT